MAYQCLTGYEAVGKPEVYCMKTGEWSFPEFKCVIGKTKIVNPVSLFTLCVYDDLMSWWVGYLFYFLAFGFAYGELYSGSDWKSYNVCEHFLLHLKKTFKFDVSFALRYFSVLKCNIDYQNVIIGIH